MALTEYKLPDINNLPVGIVKCYLYHDSSITGLTYPSKVPFSNIGEFAESIDTEVGVVDAANVQLDIVEDYSTYSEGFWWKLINGYPTLDVQIMFTVMEGTDETFLFRGSIYRDNVNFGEPYLDGLSVVRSCSIQLVSMIGAIDLVSTTVLVAECLSLATINHDDAVGDEYFVQLISIFASIIKLAFNQTYDVDMAIDRSRDVWGSYSGFQYKQWSQLWMYATIGTPSTSLYGYMGGNSPYAWTKNYGTAKALMQQLCKEFGVVAQYTFGTIDGLIDATPSNNKHRIILRSRGKRNSDSANTTISGKMIQSDFVSATPRKSNATRFTLSENSNYSSWFLNGAFNEGVNYPSDAQFDIDQQTDFGINTPALSDTLNTTRLLYMSVLPFLTRESVYLWMWHKYSTGQDFEQQLSLRTIMAQYYFYRFSPSRFQFTRTYTSIKANNGSIISQRAIQSLVQHDITFLLDGVETTVTFYASEVKKDIVNNKLTVIWVQA
jgi:hypothetical protein